MHTAGIFFQLMCCVKGSQICIITVIEIFLSDFCALELTERQLIFLSAGPSISDVTQIRSVALNLSFT